MANTFPTQAMFHVSVDDAYLSLFERRWPEGATETFLAGWPLAVVAGLVVEYVLPSTALLAAFAAEDGHNAAAATGFVKVVLARAGLIQLEANFLGAAAADNVLAAADLGLDRDIAKSATLLGAASPGWYIIDTTAADTCRILPELQTSSILPDKPESRAFVGDTNARVRAELLPAACLWG